MSTGLCVTSGSWSCQHHLARIGSVAVLCASLAGCTYPWTARVCSSNNSGNCRGVDNQPHEYTVKSTSIGPVRSVTDVNVKEPACGTNGIGAVDVEVVEQDELKVTIHCLVDAPSGTMTLSQPSAATPQPPTSTEGAQP